MGVLALPEGQPQWARPALLGIKTAARKRVAETGEPYAAARRAMVTEHRATGGQVPPPGYSLRMSGEIHY